MDETTIDLRDIIKTLKKHSKLIIYTFLSFVILAAVISFIIPPTYESETTLRVKQSKGLASSLLADLPMGNTMATKQLMSTYAEILTSRTVVQEVIDKTQQDKKEPPAYEEMIKRITTQPVKDTEILKVKVTAKSPAEAQNVADTLVAAFIDRLTMLTRSEQTVVRQFIGERLQESKKELEIAESNLQKYKQNEQIVAPSEETKAMVERLSSINKLAADNAVRLAATQGTLSSVNQQLASEKPGFVADNQLIQQYKAKLADLEVQLVSLLEKYTDKHPQVVAVKAAINETKSKLSTEVARVISAEAPSMNPIHQGLLQSRIQAEAEIAAANAQKKAIDVITAESEKELTSLPAKEQGLAKVMRDQAVAQEIYIMLAKRHEEARISEVMQPTDVQVIDIATLPEDPIKPKKALNIAIAAILGLFIGTGSAFVLEYMNKSIRTSEDVQNYLGLPVLGSIPHFDSEFKTPPPNILRRIKDLFTNKFSKNIQRGV